MTGETGVPAGVTGNERVNAFSDGVFAIAITLLVLELRVPETLPHGGVIEALVEMGPKFGGHVLSFVVLGMYWVGHHNMFMHIQRHDRVLLWLNIFYLMFIGAMPFFAGLLVQHSEDTFSLVAYAANLALIGLLQDAIWWYASSNHKLVDPNIYEDLVRFVHRRILVAPVLYLVAICVAFASHLAAILLVVVVPVTYIFPGPLDHYHHKQLAGTAKGALEG
jgi:uncharacterized membrane protein